MSGLQSYEDANGPVPHAAAFDSDGLAQQSSGPLMPMQMEQRMVDLDREQPNFAKPVAAATDSAAAAAAARFSAPATASVASASALNRVFFEVLPSGDVDALRSQLESGAIGVNERVGKGPTADRTLLHWAVSRGQRPLIELLVVDFGADTTLTDGQGKTPAELGGGAWPELIAEMLSKP